MIRLGNVLLLMLGVSTAFAGGPLNARNGLPVKYSTAAPIKYKTDLGALGTFSNTTAVSITTASFQAWEDVATAVIAFMHDGSLSVDVDSTNYTSYLSNTNDGINPIVFDSDGGIITKLFGATASNSIIGFAGSAYPVSGSGQIYYIEGHAVLNGKFTQSPHNWTPEDFKATFIHEFGHFIGLDHSQIHIQFANNGNAADDIYIPTMYPTSVDNDTALSSLNIDDILAVSALYPDPTFALTTGISGTVTRLDGSPVRGANVLAIKVTDTLMYRVSTVTDYLVQVNGNYSFAGLDPADYWIRIEPVSTNFTGGSRVGPYASDLTDLSFQNPVIAEYYNGANESSNPNTDSPNERTNVTVVATQTTSGINLVANTQPNAPETSTLEYHGTLTYVFQLPSQFDDKKYAVRFTPGADANLVRTEIRLNGDPGAIEGTGSLKVTAHRNASGSFPGAGGIPGTQIGSQSVTVPFSSLVRGQFNQIDLTSLSISLKKDTSFHLVFEVVGSAGDTIQFVGDDGVNETDRSSSYYDAGAGLQWYNFKDPKNYGTGYNLAIRAIIDIQVGTGNDEITLMPDTYSLSQNYPNPFNPTTTIRFELPKSNYVMLKVFDLLGRHVATLINQPMDVGSHEITFDASRLASGVYFYTLEAGDFRQTKSMVLLK
ncbi:MAG TPA: T9SS type A sorting domain-containing protein [Bacteroidota bacterium]|nr:T9SS type A sorting domain-containing protein [Bacteroidota bacterium]